ncbi:MAG: amino acid ABC transporter permease [Desulfovibrionales bacterium]
MIQHKRSTALELGKYLAVLLLLAGLAVRGADQLGYNWQWFRVPRYLFRFEDGHFTAGLLLQGLLVTFQITCVSLVLAVLFGLTAALLRLSHSIVARALARCYLEVIRNTPLLIQLLFVYFVLSPIFDISRFASAVLALSLFEGAYVSEIFRAGIVSIHQGQRDAAFSLGLSPYDTYRHVILPQAIRRILPPLTGQAVSLIKDSALVSVIAIYDLTMQGQAIVAETFLTFEIWFAVAAIYLCLNLTLSLLVHAMEGRLTLET